MKKNLLKICVILLLVFEAQASLCQFVKRNFDVGVFYMPFWSYPGSDPMDGNWEMINNYDAFLVNKGLSHLARIPEPNYWPSPVWYDEKEAYVTEQQFALMKSNEIDFVVIDSYWNYYSQGDYFGASYEHVLANLVQPGFNFNGMEFALMWANDFKDILKATSCERYLRGASLNDGIQGMTAYWSQFINHPNYKKINGKPVFYIYYPSFEVELDNTSDIMNNNISGMMTFCAADPFFAPLGSDASDPDKRTRFFLETLEQMIGQELYFVAVMTPDANPKYVDDVPRMAYYQKWLVDHPVNAGFDAVTSYGYKYYQYSDTFNPSYPPCRTTISILNWNYDYNTMQRVHSDFYSFILSNSNLDYQVPVSAGWNRGPYTMHEVVEDSIYYEFPDSCNNFTLDPLDRAIATPAMFEQSLITARNVAFSDSVKTRNIIMLSAWNEYAEGTVIEPNHQWGDQFLQKVNDVFSCDTPLISPLDYTYFDDNSINQINDIQPYASVPNNIVCAVGTTFTANFSFSGATSVVPEIYYQSDPGAGWGTSGNHNGLSVYSYFTGYNQQIIFKITATGPCGTEIFYAPFRSEECPSQFRYVISPNPASNELRVNAINEMQKVGELRNSKPGNFKVKLYNEKGQVLRQADNQKEGAITFNTSGLENGTYYLHIIEGKNIIKKQVIIQH